MDPTANRGTIYDLEGLDLKINLGQFAQSCLAEKFPLEMTFLKTEPNKYLNHQCHDAYWQMLSGNFLTRIENTGYSLLFIPYVNRALLRFTMKKLRNVATVVCYMPDYKDGDYTATNLLVVRDYFKTDWLLRAQQVADRNRAEHPTDVAAQDHIDVLLDLATYLEDVAFN